MADFELEPVLELAREAGELARGYFGRVGAERKADNTIVTRADREVEELVRRRLGDVTPDWPVLGEEQGRSGIEIDRGRPFWVVDPVDGTSAFSSHIPCWCFSLGLVDGGRARFGVIYLPMTDEMYYTGVDGEGVYLNGREFPAEEPLEIDSESVIYAPSDSHRGYRIDFPGKTRSLGSAAYHGILAGRARTAGALQGRVYIWDMAACLAIANAWGLRVGELDGRKVTASDWELEKQNATAQLIAHSEHFDYVARCIEPVL